MNSSQYQWNVTPTIYGMPLWFNGKKDNNDNIVFIKVKIHDDYDDIYFYFGR